MSEAPPFWFAKPGIISWALSPASLIYGRIAARRMKLKPSGRANVPVFCIGNLVAGGAGKTPTAIAVAKIARKSGLRPGFLSRGYGGHVRSATLVDPKTHTAVDVGDEPLILTQYGATVVSPDRPAGAMLLEEQGVDFIIMDDGFQNPALHKDYSLVVVDAGRGIGNGFCIPAGPLRAELRAQLAAASAVLLIGRSEAGAEIVRRCARIAKPVLSAEVKERKPREWRNRNLFAYCGIADPQKFLSSLQKVGANVVKSRQFNDHHPYSADECQELMQDAKSENLVLATTEKDAVRLTGAGGPQQDLKEKSKVLGIDLVFENPKLIEMAIQTTVENAAAARIAAR